MPGKDFLFGFKFLATDYVSPVLKNIESRIESVNAQVKNTARWREAGTNLAMMGAGMAVAGGALALAIRSTVNAAADMRTEMSHVATAMNDGADNAVHLAQAQAMSEKMAIASGIAAKQEADAYYIARSNMLDHAQAMAAVDVATKLTIGTTASLTDAQAQLEPTTRLLTTVFQNFGQKGLDANKQIAGFADTMAKLQTQYAFKGIDEVNNAMQYSVPVAKAAGIAFNDMSAGLALLSESGLHGAEAGTAFSEVVTKLAAGGKLKALTVQTAQGGIDFEKTMERLHTATAGMTQSQSAMWLHQMGFTERSIRGVSLLIDKTGQYRQTITALNNAQGANAAAFATRQAAPDVVMGRFTAAMDVLEGTLGAALLPTLTSLVNKATQLITHLHFFAEDHPTIVKYGMAFAAIGAAVLLTGGGLAIAGGALMGFVSFLPAVKAVGAAFHLGAAATKVWTAAQWLLNAAMDANPIALTIIGAAALAVAAYEVYEHWATVRTFFMNWGGWAYTAGANLVKAIASGIWSAITFPQHAMEAVVTKIRAYLPFSPAHEGPLRNLNQMRLVETMAETIRPGPALAAIRRTAAAIAIAAPMTIAPAIPAMARASGGAGGGGIVIQVRQEIRIDGAAAGDAQKLLATLRAHGEELADIIDRRLTHRARREF